MPKSKKRAGTAQKIQNKRIATKMLKRKQEKKMQEYVEQLYAQHASQSKLETEAYTAIANESRASEMTTSAELPKMHYDATSALTNALSTEV